MIVPVIGVALLIVALAHSARADEPVRLVYAADIAPLSFAEQGQVRGILVDVASDIFRNQLGVPVIAELYPWERAQNMVRQGEADGFITVATAARRQYAFCGKLPVLQAVLHPLVRRNHPLLPEIAAAQDLESLRGYHFVSYSGNGWAKEHLEGGGYDVSFAADFSAHLRGLAQNRGDVALVTATSGAYYVNQLGLEDELIMLPLVVDTFEYVLCLGKKSPYAGKLAAFDAALGLKRNNGSYARVLEAYGLNASTPY